MGKISDYALSPTPYTGLERILGDQFQAGPTVQMTSADVVASLGSLTVNTFAAIATATIPTYLSLIQTRGYTTAGIGNATYAVTATTGSTAYRIQGLDGRWWQLVGPIVTPQMVGAMGDGVTNDSAAWTSALAGYNYIYVPYTAQGYNLSSAQFTVGSGQFVQGQNRTLLKSISSSSIFRCTGFNTESGIAGFTFDMTGSPGTAIIMGTATGIVFRVTLEDLRFQNCVQAYNEETHTTNYVSDVRCMTWYCEQTRGLQINSKRSRGFFLWRDIQVDHSFNTIHDPSGAGAWADYAGLELERVDGVVLGRNPAGGRTFINTQAFLFTGNTSSGGNAAVWLKRVFADTCDMNGIVVTNTNYIFLDNFETVNCLGLQASFTGCQRLKMTNSLLSGATGTSGAVASQPGLLIDTCTGFLIATTEVLLATGDGVLAHNAEGVSMTACEIDLNSGWGFNETGGSLKNTLAGTIYSANTSGNSNLSGLDSTDNFPVNI